MITFIIPAYKPTAALIPLVKSLCALPNAAVVIVNDGTPDAGAIFADPAFSQTHVLHHAVNRGKGAALKTAFDYALRQFPGAQGAITLDADGQHTASDVQALATYAMTHPATFTLGVRTFDKAGSVPLRSRLGNQISIKVWHWLTGVKLADTQTGLRYLPRDFMRACLTIEADRYEFETEMLLLAHQQHLPLHQVPIATIYLDHNASSHFNPILDSLKIYFVLFRFALSSLACTALDYVVYIGLLTLNTITPAVAFAGARTISLGLNFQLNRRAVFKSPSTRGQFLKYLVLVLANIVLGAWAVQHASEFIPHIAAKVLVDLMLFVANFSIQREFIFAR